MCLLIILWPFKNTSHVGIFLIQVEIRAQHSFLKPKPTCTQTQPVLMWMAQIQNYYRVSIESLPYRPSASPIYANIYPLPYPLSEWFQKIANNIYEMCFQMTSSVPVMILFGTENSKASFCLYEVERSMKLSQLLEKFGPDDWGDLQSLWCLRLCTFPSQNWIKLLGF